jgi:hypothetical protein
MRMAFALLALLSGACAQTPANNQGAALSERWLVGGWVPEGENCASDAGIVYNVDRTWAAEGTIGTWSIDGGRIVTLITQQDDGETGMRPVAPTRNVQRIEVTGADGFVSRMDDGSVLRWVRCPG